MNDRLKRLLSGSTATALLWATVLPVTAYAQDEEGNDWGDEDGLDFSEPLDFSEEGGEDWGDGEDWTDDGAGDDWSTEEPVIGPTPVVDDGVINVTGLFVPSSTLDPLLADQLTDSLMIELGTLEGFGVVPNDSLREQFEIMGAELAYECAFDPVCIGRYGAELGLDKIVIGRVDAAGNGWGTTIDLMDSGSSSIENYRYFTTESRLAAVQEVLPAQLRTLFGIRVVREGGGDVVAGISPLQKAMAWTTLALGVGAFSTGVVFGLGAKSTESDLESCPETIVSDGRAACLQTQREAQADIDDGKQQALLANVFMGAGLFLTAGSIVLFTVSPGSDIDEGAELSRGPRDFRLAPVFARGGFGVEGGFNF
jgi:hypothetical protein